MQCRVQTHLQRTVAPVTVGLRSTPTHVQVPGCSPGVAAAAPNVWMFTKGIPSLRPIVSKSLFFSLVDGGNDSPFFIGPGLLLPLRI